MAREKKASGGSDLPTCPGWMATYGDMVTLVLTFFVLLFSFSTVDALKWKDIVGSLTGTTPQFFDSVFDNLDIPDNPSLVPAKAGASDASSIFESSDSIWENLYKYITEYAAKNTQKGKMEIDKNDHEIHIRVESQVLFDSGKADLKPESIGFLQSVLEIVEPELPYIESIMVEGHTDSIPMMSEEFPDNTALSMYRAYNLARALNGQLTEFPPGMLQPIGKGEFYPIGDNSTPEGRQANRRCEIVLIRKSVQ